MVFSPNTNRTDPAIKTAIAQTSKNSAKGDGMPLDAMAGVPLKSLSLPGSALTKSAEIRFGPADQEL